MQINLLFSTTGTIQPFSDNHFATFPEKLIIDCIKAGCPEYACYTCGKPYKKINIPDCKCKALITSGIVMDIFMGAGTTAVVCRKLHRNFIGIEMSAKNIKLSNRRLHKELGIFI
jgi:DNA modification methylase